MKAINGVSRRAFLGLGATAAAGAAANGTYRMQPQSRQQIKHDRLSFGRHGRFHPVVPAKA